MFFVSVAASTNILIFFNERAAASEIYLLKEKMYGCFWKKNYVAASLRIMFTLRNTLK